MPQEIELPAPREIPEDLSRGMSAQGAVAELLRRQRAATAKMEERILLEQGHADRLAERVALEVYKKRRGDQAAAFRGLLSVLGEEGVVLVTHEGEPLTEALEEAADIFEWLPAVGPGPERAVEAMEPEIRRGGRLIHRAKLSCMQAGPSEEGELPGETPAIPEDTVRVGAACPQESAPSGQTPPIPEDFAPAEAAPSQDSEPPSETPPIPEDFASAGSTPPQESAPSIEPLSIPEDFVPAKASPSQEGAPPAETATQPEGRMTAPWYDLLIQKATAARTLAKAGARAAARAAKHLINTVRGGKTP